MRCFAFDLESTKRFRQIFVRFLFPAFYKGLYLYGARLLPGQLAWNVWRVALLSVSKDILFDFLSADDHLRPESLWILCAEVAWINCMSWNIYTKTSKQWEGLEISKYLETFF